MHWLSFFIGALLGWLIGWLIDILICRPRRRATEAELRAKLEHANKESAALQAQLSGHKDLQARLDGSRREMDALRGQLAGMGVLQGNLAACQAETRRQQAEIERLNADLAAAATRSSGVNLGVVAPGATTHKPDDLTVIEGIGAKITELLADNGIRTFADLTATSVERLRAILDLGGPRFRTANPQTWAEQASLAHDGKWDALKALQDSLQGGRRG